MKQDPVPNQEGKDPLSASAFKRLLARYKRAVYERVYAPALKRVPVG